MSSSVYENDRMVSDYLLFHYAGPSELLPWPDGPAAALDFPKRCAEMLVSALPYPSQCRGLDMGCAVGGATFALSRDLSEVTGVDYSSKFVDAANAMRVAGFLQVSVQEEGDRYTPIMVHLPEGSRPEQCLFRTGDACAPNLAFAPWDAVLAANLVCRLYNPAAFLAALPNLVRPGGVALLTTPCTWLEEFTPRERWLSQPGQTTLEGLHAHLDASFVLEKTADLPFLIREHARKYQWSIAQASLWRRNEHPAYTKSQLRPPA